jgi:hypothetical protein
MKKGSPNSLGRWEEIVGKLVSVEEVDGELVVNISSVSRLRFPPNSHEARLVRDELEGREGDRIGVLRTDLAKRPIVVTEVKNDL